MDRARSEKTIAELVEEDRNDPSTPDHFDVPLKSLGQVEDELDDPEVVGRLGVAGNAYNIGKILEGAQLLRSWGWTVVFMDGWSTRGADRRQLAVHYLGDHHTAATIDVDRILRDGRDTIPGPLCEIGVHADSTIVVVAAGPANHFGVATIDSSDALGVENTGPIPLTASGKAAFPNYRATLAVYVAFRRVFGLQPVSIVLHKETARPVGRKIDRAVDGDTVRSEAAVTEVLRNPEEPDMPLTLTDADTVWKNPIDIPVNYAKEYARKPPRYTSEELLFSAQYHAQEGHEKIAAILAAVKASAVREGALLAAVAKMTELLAAGTGIGFTREEMQEMLDEAAVKAVEGLDLDVVLVKEPAPVAPAPTTQEADNGTG